MARSPGAITTMLSLATCVLSIPFIIAGVWLMTASVTMCVKWMEWPLLTLGILTLLISLAGFLGGRCHSPCLQWTYFLLLFLDILLLLILTIFFFVVTAQAATVLDASPLNNNNNHRAQQISIYSLQSYPDWLRKQVQENHNWRRIVRCIREAGYCEDLIDSYSIGTFFGVVAGYHSPIQEGCCRPLDVCGYQFIDPIHWMNPKDEGANKDCLRWSNDPSRLCYRCDSCKSGVLQMIRHNWRKAAKVSLVFLIFLIIAYTMGCCAFLSSTGRRQPGCGGRRWLG